MAVVSFRSTCALAVSPRLERSRCCVCMYVCVSLSVSASALPAAGDISAILQFLSVWFAPFRFSFFSFLFLRDRARKWQQAQYFHFRVVCLSCQFVFVSPGRRSIYLKKENKDTEKMQRRRTSSITYAGGGESPRSSSSDYASVPLSEQSIDEKQFQNLYGQSVPKKNCSQKCNSWARSTFTSEFFKTLFPPITWLPK